MIAILGAMDQEVNALLKLMTDVHLVQDSDLVHYQGTFNNYEVVVAKTGIGKVEAAYTLTRLLNTYDIQLVINIGSAGGLHAGQKVGDVVIGNSFVYHDMIFDYHDPSEGIERFEFSSSPKNVEIMKKALDDLKIRNWIGQIVTGDQFVHYAPQYEYILQRFPYAICTEMEATAIAHVCTRSNVEFIVIRSLSDITIEESSVTDFEKYLPLASTSSANACLLFLSKWER